MSDLFTVPNRRPMNERVLDCFPAGVYALHALLRLLDVVESDEVPTAAVECRVQPRMLVNPFFVDQWAPTPEKLLMLVMHELHHVLLGHTRLFPRVSRVDNLVFDAVINSLLCRMFPELEYTSFFTDLYKDTAFPDCLLRPVQGWPFEDTKAGRRKRNDTMPAALTAPEMRELADVYRALYSPTGATYDDLYAAFARHITEELAALVPLLGDHGAQASATGTSSDGNLEQRSPLLLDVVRQIVEQWPQPPDPIRGRSLAEVLRTESVLPDRRPSNRARLRRLLRRVGGVEHQDGPNRSLAPAPLPLLTSIPTRDRRAVVLRALGQVPLFFGSELPLPRRQPAGERVHVYVDVSGSIGDLKGALYGAVLDCREFVYPTVHLFSTAVADVSLEDLRRGRCESTGGTAIDCVARHIQEHGVRRAVIVTDGFVGRPEGNHHETLLATRLGVALAPGQATRSDLDEVANSWEVLI